MILKNGGWQKMMYSLSVKYFKYNSKSDVEVHHFTFGKDL